MRSCDKLEAKVTCVPLRSEHIIMYVKPVRAIFISAGASLVPQMVKNLPAMQETRVQSLGWEDPLEMGMTTHSSILAGKLPEQRSLAGYSRWGGKESDMTM